jgi:hypothetical protein
MKKSKYITTFLRNPLAVIISGLKAQYEVQFKKGLQAEHGISQLPTVDLLEFFDEFNEELYAYSFLEGTSLITDLMLLRKIAGSFPACEYLEIGSWRGESIRNISEVAAHCTAVTLSPKEMLEMGLSQGFVDVHGLYSKGVKNITEILANSRNFDFNGLGKKFDLIFIDGDHTYEGVLNDTKKTFNLRKDSSSVIVWHDYGFSMETVRPSVLKAIMDGIPKEKHKNLYHVSNTMCAVYIENRNFKTYQTKFPTFPNKRFSLQLKTNKL